MTVALPVRLPLRDAALATQAMAVAALQAVLDLGGPKLGIKWVNDLVLSGRKISGTLTELSLEAESGLVGYAVVGVKDDEANPRFRLLDEKTL